MSLALLVNADDFGLDESVNEGIERAHTEGILSSASLMANGRAFEDAVARARRLPELALGAHCTLIEERPLLDPGEVPSLVDADGRFHASAGAFLARHLAARIALEEVRAELRAQLRRIADTALPIGHVDSHQHVHVLPGVRRVVCELAAELGIRRVRRPLERVQGWMLARPARYRRVAEMVVLGTLARSGSWHGLEHTTHFAGFHAGGRLDAEALREIVRRLPRRGSVELMCHPGSEAEVPGYAHWGYRWADELAALTSADVLAEVRRRAR